MRFAPVQTPAGLISFDRAPESDKVLLVVPALHVPMSRKQLGALQAAIRDQMAALDSIAEKEFKARNFELPL